MRRRSRRTLYFVLGRPLWKRRRHRPSRRPSGRYPRGGRQTAIIGGALLLGAAGLMLAVNGSRSPRAVDGVARAAGDDEIVDAVTAQARSGEQTAEKRATPRQGVVRFRLATNHEGGSVYCGLFAEDSWPGLPVQVDVEPVEDGSVVCEFDGVERGAYAAAAFHDENGNDNLDLNWLGLPEEEWTFSRNVRRLLPLPKFEDIKFEFSGGRKTVAAKLE